MAEAEEEVTSSSAIVLHSSHQFTVKGSNSKGSAFHHNRMFNGHKKGQGSMAIEDMLVTVGRARFFTD